MSFCLYYRHFLKRNRSSERTSNKLNLVSTRKWLSDECLPQERIQSCSTALLSGTHQTCRSSSKNIRHTGKDAQPSRERPERKPLLPNQDLCFKRRLDQNATLSLKPPVRSSASKENIQGAVFRNIPSKSEVDQPHKVDGKLESIRKTLSRSMGPRLKTALFKVFRKHPLGKNPKSLWRKRRDQSPGRCALKNAMSCVELDRRTPPEDIRPRRWRSNEALTGRWLETQQRLEDEEEGEGDEVMSDCESLFSLDSLSSAYATALAERLRRDEEEEEEEQEERYSEDSQMSEDSLTVKSVEEKMTVKKLHRSPLVDRPHAASTETHWSQHELAHATRNVAKPKSRCQKAVEENSSGRIAVENLQTSPTSGAWYPSSSSVWESKHLQALDPWSSVCAADSARVPRTCVSVQRKDMFLDMVSSSSSSAASLSLSEGRVSTSSSTSARDKGEKATVKGHILVLEATPQRSQKKASPDKPLTGAAGPEGQSQGLLDSHSLRTSQVKSIRVLSNVENGNASDASESPVAKVSSSCCPPGEISHAFAASTHSARAEGQCCLHAASGNILKNNQKSEPAGDGAPSSAWDEQPTVGESEGGGERCGAAQQELVRSDCKNSRKRNKEQRDAFTGSLKMLKRSNGAESAASCTAAVGSQGEIWLGGDSKGKLSVEAEQVRAAQHLLPVSKGIGPICPKQKESDCQNGTSARSVMAVESASVTIKSDLEEESQETSPHTSKLAAICSAIDLRISEVVNEHVRLSFVRCDDEGKEAIWSLKTLSPDAAQSDYKRLTESQLRVESYGRESEMLASDQPIKSRSGPESRTLTSPEVASDFSYSRGFYDVASNVGRVDPCCIKNCHSDLISHKESRELISQTVNSNSNEKGFDLREPAAIKDTFQQASQLVHKTPASPPDHTVSETQVILRSTIESNQVLFEAPPPGGAREEGCNCGRVMGVSTEAVSDLKDLSNNFAKQNTLIPILHSHKCLDHNLPLNGGNLQSKEHGTKTAVDGNVSVTKSTARQDKTGQAANVKKSAKPHHVVQKCVVNVRYSDKCHSCVAKSGKESATSRSETSTVSENSETNKCSPLKSERKMTQDASFNQSVTSSTHTHHNVAAASRKVKRLRRSKVQTGLTSSQESSLKSSDEEDSQSSGVHHNRLQPRCVSQCSQHSRKQEFTQGRKSTSDIFPKVPERYSEAKTLEENLDKVKTGQDSTSKRNCVLCKQTTGEENQQQQHQIQKPRDASMHFACSDINPFVCPWKEVNPAQLTRKSPTFGSAADLSRMSPPLITGSVGVRMARCCSVDDGLNGPDPPPFNSHLSAFTTRRGLSSTLSSVEDGDREQVAGSTSQLGSFGQVDEIMFVYSMEQDGVTLRSKRSCERWTQTAAPPAAAAAKQRERHRRSCTDGVAVAAQRSSSLRESQTWASMESMSAHISKLIDSTSDLLEDVQEMRTGGGGRGKRWSADLSAAATTKRDGSTQKAADVAVQTERPSTPLPPNQHSVNLVVRVVTDDTVKDVPVTAQRRNRSASSRGSRRGTFTDRASSPILTVGVRRGSRPKVQQAHSLQRRGENSFTMPPNHQSEGTTVRQDSEGPLAGGISLKSSLDFGEKQKRRRLPSVSAKAFNTQSISPIMRSTDDPKQQVVVLGSLEVSVDACRQSPSFSVVTAADLLQEDETTSLVPSECNTDILVNMKPVGADSENHQVVPEDLPLHNKFNNWSGIATRPPAAPAEWSEAEESSSTGPVGGRRAGEIERLRRERERLLATVGLGGNPTPLSVELKEAKLHYGLGETDTLLKMLSVMPSCREEELLQASKEAATKQQLYERWECSTSVVELE